MSSVVIPKERLSAYQRWELGSLDDGNPIIALPTVEQIPKLREDAQQEGYAAGFEEGRRAGEAEGRQRSAEIAEQLARLAQGFRAELLRADDCMANEIVDLALDVAKAVLKVGLEIRPDLVIPVVSEAVRYLPSVQHPAVVSLNPEDVALVEEHLHEDLAEGGWRVAEDAAIERGGCRIETATNQIDATVNTRWKRLAGSLSRSSDWLS
jgi:flagellar assembly protein FliH